MPSATSPRSPTVAAALSVLFPGLGQLYAGRPRRALLVALPVLALLIGAGLLLVADWQRVAATLLHVEVLVAVLIGLVALFLYHAWAIVDAYRLARARRPTTADGPAASTDRASPGLVGRFAAVAPLVVILALSGVLYAVPLYVGVRAAPNLARLFPDGERGGSVPPPSWEMSPSPGPATPTDPPAGPTGSPDPAATPTGTPTPGATPTPAPTATPFSGPEWARDGRLNILLLGSDEGPGRWSLRTDAVFLVSIDIESGRSAIFGFPRYMSSIPLPPPSSDHYPGGRFPGYLNALYREAQDRPNRFPYNDEIGLAVLAAAIQEITHVRVDHYAMVNLNGFVDLVNAMGGLWIDVPEPGVYDDRYVPESGRGHLPVRIRPGCQKLDGTMALAFSRSRHQDGDYGRMSRQTVTINALRRQFDPLAVLPQLPDLFDIAGNNVHWTLTPEDLTPMAQVLRRVDPDQMERVLFIPPEYRRGLGDPTLERIRAKVAGIFEEPFDPEPTSSPDGSGGSCPP